MFGSDKEKGTVVNGSSSHALPPKPGDDMEVDAEGNDPLDAFMADVTTAVAKIQEEDAKLMAEADSRSAMPEEEERGELVARRGSDDEEAPEEDIMAIAAQRAKAVRKDLVPVDHSTITYEPFRKDFFIEPDEVGQLTADEVEIIRLELEGIKIRGQACPKPIRKWTQFGLPPGVLEVIRKHLKFEKPSPIQAQAMPAIMAGRDVIGVAKTGSGKTLAFVLPMLRHIKDQRAVNLGEGPVGLIMTPTRELAVQIHREMRPFARVLGLRTVCAYGGAPIKDQIAELKRGAEIIVCTPGRMIDLLCANSGRVTNLRRVTYLVLDEADRMFDMGFEPQVMKIITNIRPDRQTVLFSATFPRQMEALARKILRRPLEITVGGRSTVADTVDQRVEVQADDDKFPRLLHILGEWYDDSKDQRALIFVDRQEAADSLLRDLLRRGYPCQSLHGGKDQVDRDATIQDFKQGNIGILIATSVAARGLDVKSLNLVVNYECPNHMEDYVHRVGRTGRAGNKGVAYTFITPEQDRYSVDIVKALIASKATIPEDVQKLADAFIAKVKAGNAQAAGSGFGGKGLEKLDAERDRVKKAEKKLHGGGLDEEEEDDIEPDAAKPKKQANPAAPGQNGDATTVAGSESHMSGTGVSDAIKAAKEAAKRVSQKIGTSEHASKLEEIRQKLMGQGFKEERPKEAEVQIEIEINDYPQKARWKVTNKDTISTIIERTGAAITTRGLYYPPDKPVPPGERKLYLVVEGESEYSVENARWELMQVIKEAAIQAAEQEARGGGRPEGRYLVV
ncbi:P-loop containing nucleoside triphosphate hydrolase protein [Gonapodya prolifera JEL478]|uniref:RNA helicase n=1 Tax=Gonapodya prolifera (strain JEL478) TaxID=1344416 RepID=A0A139AT72_GONPJ|nr:P-loop containing nucleoside triphosphate hydrolase protein [Gonapodya prolifera JEL478]|eukprot:KXS19921.1 P-loop containing nucleoside triphosphate hydrolase protein [Gonapodya prolifera JEL478]